MSAIPSPVHEYLAAEGYGQVTRQQAVGGGCINDGRVLTASSGRQAFLKSNSAAPADMFEREAEGLAALEAAPDGPRVPAVLLVGGSFLLLEYLAPSPAGADYWPGLGRRLARLHSVTDAMFGFAHDNFLGSTPQPNTRHADGHVFFAEQRLRYQGALAAGRGLIGTDLLARLERLAGRLKDLVPAQPASLLHGDLWSGNIIAGPGGQACLIDPAAHFGWAEADLAMTALFGRLPQEFYDAYEVERPLAPGYRERFDLYNLYHLLNHLNLFGTGYLGAVETVVSAYG